MKRIRVSRIDEMIHMMESIESGEGSDYPRWQAINYLKSYEDTLGDMKTVRLREVNNNAQKKD